MESHGCPSRRHRRRSQVLLDDLYAIDCGPVSLAMSADALTGFLAWLESAPPSAYLDVA
ncbi:DUF2550 family protein [Nonomuraea sp. NPDC055795]